MDILDCTLRDGGYYTNWDFDTKLVDTYIESFNRLPVKYLEIGYRSRAINGAYMGEYFYLPIYVLERIKNKTNKKLAIILNEKDTRIEDLPQLLQPCIGYVDLVRIAIDPTFFGRALTLAKGIKEMGFKVGFNVMYMSKWKQQQDFLEQLPAVNEIADYFYMVDSYGGVYPEDVREICEIVKQSVPVPIGFHGHNNLELALINTLTAVACGATIVDATITGMGRGAGNLKTELLLTALSAKGELKFDFNALSRVVDEFSKLQEQYGWGTNLPYMFSGAHSLPQKNVMDWVSKRYYSFNSIIRALDTQVDKNTESNKPLPLFPESGVQRVKEVLIIGGGGSAVRHEQAIKLFLEQRPETIVIHASSKNAMIFEDIKNTQVFCLVGNEGLRMEEVFSGDIPQSSICILPPSPREMGTYIPQNLTNRAYELKSIDFTDKYTDSHTAIALQATIDLHVENIYIIGYDGYDSSEVKTKDHELFIENEFLFDKIKNKTTQIISLTQTKYNNLSTASVFSKI